MYPDYQKKINKNACEGSQVSPACPGKCNIETKMRV